jgi:membrane-bound ClpP family serine protease
MIEPLLSCPSDPMSCVEHLIGYGFTMVFGNPIYSGLFLLIVLVAIGAAIRMSGDTFILYILVSIILVGTQFLGGNWITMIFLIGAGVVFAFALQKLIRSR